jgi:hypothetical protein
MRVRETGLTVAVAFALALLSSGKLVHAAGSGVDSWTAVGVGVGSPYGISGRLWSNVGWVKRGDGDPWGSISRLGVVWELQAGSGGGKVALGYGLGGLGVLALKGVASRTWYRPWWADRAATYVGGEIEIGALFYSLSLGKLWRVGEAGDKRSVFTLQFVLQVPPGTLH